MDVETKTPEASVDGGKNLDDKKTGTWVTASARIITAAIGSGVLSLAWAFAQVGWVAGPAVLLAFSFVAYFTSTLLADSYRSPDCYRSPDPDHDEPIYFRVVRSVLGRRKSQLFRLAVCVNLISVTIGSTITASINMGAVRSNCSRESGLCYRFAIIFACIQIVLSQKPNFHKLSWLSIVKAVMSFAYSFIGLGLSIAKAPGGGPAQASLKGVQAGAEKKVWRTFQAIGNIAYAYAGPDSNELTEIQDTLKSSAPEYKVMKRASLIGISTTTLFYMLCGTLGYAAYGNKAPGNFLTGTEPFWLINLAYVCVVVQSIGEYQDSCQPIFQFVESKSMKKWSSQFVIEEHAIPIPLCGTYKVNFFRVVWRTTYVIITALIAMIFPLFNDFLGLIGSLSFWPLTVYFPIEVYIKQFEIHRFSFKWTLLMILSWAFLIVSIISAAGSIQGLVQEINLKPFAA